MRKFDMTPTLGNKPLVVPPTLLESVSVLSLPDGARIDGVFRWVTPDPLDADYHTLPTELYFRGLMELDLDDDEAVFGFC